MAWQAGQIETEREERRLRQLPQIGFRAARDPISRRQIPMIVPMGNQNRRQIPMSCNRHPRPIVSDLVSIEASTVMAAGAAGAGRMGIRSVAGGILVTIGSGGAEARGM